jgi:hypothetical protein
MNHDHLQCDHLMMRRHDTNRMDAMTLDGKMMNHHVKHRKKDDLKMVYLMKI